MDRVESQGLLFVTDQRKTHYIHISRRMNDIQKNDISDD